MTLQTFLNLTAAVSEPTLRRALTLALSVERPTSAEGYARFYRRVLAALCATSCTDGDPVSQEILHDTRLTWSEPEGWPQDEHWGNTAANVIAATTDRAKTWIDARVDRRWNEEHGPTNRLFRNLSGCGPAWSL